MSEVDLTKPTDVRSVRLVWVPNKEDHEEAQTLFIHKDWGGGSPVRAKIMLGLTLGGLLCLLAIRASQFPWGLLITPILYVVVLWIIRWRAKKNEIPEDATEIVVELSIHGLRFVNTPSLAVLHWQGFSELLESKRLIVLVAQGRQNLVILAKRAFPSEDCIQWLREQPLGTSACAQGIAAPGRRGEIVARFRLGFFSSVDRTLAAWFTRLFPLFMFALVGLAQIWTALNPPPNANKSGLEVFLFSALLISVLTPFFVTVFVIRNWMQARPTNVDTEVRFRDSGFTCHSALAEFTLTWSQLARYKETCWHFFIWDRPTTMCLQVPKAAFASPADVDVVRGLLAQHLESSTWLWQ